RAIPFCLCIDARDPRSVCADTDVESVSRRTPTTAAVARAMTQTCVKYARDTNPWIRVLRNNGEAGGTTSEGAACSRTRRTCAINNANSSSCPEFQQAIAWQAMRGFVKLVSNVEPRHTCLRQQAPSRAARTPPSQLPPLHSRSVDLGYRHLDAAGRRELARVPDDRQRVLPRPRGLPRAGTDVRARAVRRCSRR